MAAAVVNNRKDNKVKRRFIKPTTIFIFLMLFYPCLQFAIMWFGVNINSILLTFKDKYMGWLPMESLFKNYINVFDNMRDPSIQKMYLNSLVYLVLNCFITLPISLFFAYFIFKKIYMGGVFKVIYYLPSVLPTVILTLVYQSMFNTGGLLYPVFNALGLNSANFFLGGTERWMVWIFCFWTGIGYDVMLLTAGMARIPSDLLESAKMDGVPPLKEFVHIIIPLTWPTITTLFIFGMMGVFGTYLQPMLLTGTTPSTITIGLQIFNDSQGAALNNPATMGMVCTLIATPIVLGIRALLNSFFKEVNF
ncbi:MAG: sugar ABC transporter permease [Erysipelotrichales bacterium]|nr:sugar ABC transporter permease [Erysipelotrichales bacterium]